MKAKAKKKLSKHLLHFAENDQFLQVLYLLLSPSSGPHVNFNARTKSGDYLVTLLAYATGELSGGGNVKQRLYALKCLKIVLDADFTAVNKVASDGGAALHCAMAAASCDDGNHDNHEDLGDGDSDSDSDSSDDEDGNETDYSDSDDEDSNIDRDYVSAISESAVKDQTLESCCPEFDSFSSEEIMLAAILLLLDHGADPNIPLGNVYAIRSSSWNGGDDLEDEEDELELTFARESIIQQWTPLMFATQWIVIACIKCLAPNEEKDKCDNYKSIRFRRLALSIVVLRLLIDFDADIGYMMAGQVIRDWNLVQVLASVSHILRGVSISNDTFTNIMGDLMAKCKGVLVIQHKNDISDSYINNGDNISVGEFIDNLIKPHDLGLAPIEEYSKAILAQHVTSMGIIIDNESASKSIDKKDLQTRWNKLSIEEILPSIQAAWAYSSLHGKSLLDVACTSSSIEVIELMISGERDCISEEQIRKGIISVFEDLGRRSKIGEDRTNIWASEYILGQQRAKICAILQKSVNESDTNELNLRQRILDRLLLESCTRKEWTIHSPHSTLVLLTLGADPNVASILSETHDALTPLHLVAGNCRGDEGVKKVRWLLGQYSDNEPVDDVVIFDEVGMKSYEKANIFAITKSSRELPINIALRKQNFVVAAALLQSTGEKWMATNWSHDDAILIGQLAIDQADITLLKQSLQIVVSSAASAEGATVRNIEKAVGGLLLKAIDERSGFGRVRPVSTAIANTMELISAVEEIVDTYNLKNLASWARDEISGQNLLHLILRGDRERDFRISLLHPVCDLIMKSDGGEKIISQRCADKFGGYSPLHLAVALECQESVRTLMNFNAEVDAVDAEGKMADISNFA